MEFGFATSITADSYVQPLINALHEYNCDSVRLAMNNSAVQTGSRTYNENWVKAMLDAGFTVVADCNHTFGSGAAGRLQVNEVVKAHMEDIKARCRRVATLFGSYGNRFKIEVFNEVTDINLQNMLQEVIDDLRKIGYNGWINYHLLPGEGPQNPLTFTDPCIAGGWHTYFQNATTTTSLMNRTMLFVDKVILSLNTEIGAAYATGGTEYDNYTPTNVGLVTKYLDDCYRLGKRADGNRKVVNFLWMNKNLENLK